CARWASVDFDYW
nr:immunoglobulin heavy chain junction region [Macaca mulatta]